MLKLKHILHPLKTAGAAKTLLSTYRQMEKIVADNELPYRGDPRYRVQNVVEGSVPRIDESADDTAVLERICAAYARATEKQRRAPRVYSPTSWWNVTRNGALRSVHEALVRRDLKALSAMYRNFYRDPCSAGLIGPPFHLYSKRFGSWFESVAQRWFLLDALHRIDIWKAATGNRFAIEELASPAIGNPFGLQLDLVFVAKRAEYHHYFAQRIHGLLAGNEAVVAEIGGGYGAMAYYLLRDRPALTYIDFDLPDSLALAAYYLLRALPDRSFLLYGEEKFDESSLRTFDIVLLPAFELDNLRARTVDLTFSAHTISDLSEDAISHYVEQIVRITREFFLYTGHADHHALFRMLANKGAGMTQSKRRELAWDRLQLQPGSDIESLYRISSK